MKDKPLIEKMEYCMRLQDELTEMYKLVNMLFIICIRKGLRLIMENPYSEEHYLRRYWCYQPKVIDKDRRMRGDHYAKPTQYWFLNIEPQHNMLWEAIANNGIDSKDAIRFMNKEQWQTTGASSLKTARSMIHPEYANRFIREMIVEE